MSKRSDRWSDTAPAALEPGLVMLDPVSGCEVKIRRLETQPGGVLIEYEPGPAGIGYLAAEGSLIRTRKVEQDGK